MNLHLYSPMQASSSASLPFPFPPPISFLLPKLSSTSPNLVSIFRFPRIISRSRSPLHATFPTERQFSDTEEEDEEEEEEAREEDDEAAAEDYEEVLSVGVSDEEEEVVQPSAGAFSRFEEHKWQRVQRLLSDVREFGEDIIDFAELASIYDFSIDKFQRLAIQAFLRGSSVVVSAPTSSGKTLIAEASALATIARGRRLFYTTPLKALSNQKFRDFRKTFGETNVGLLTGDSAVNKDAHVLIMTTEILRNMLYQSIGTISSGSRLFHVDVIVLDEVHYLSDISRGTVWEEIVIYCPKEVQLICLSATVANPDELAGWIEQIHGKTELVTSKKRPVPLTWHFSLKSSLLPLLDDRGQKMNRNLSLDYMQLSPSRTDTYSGKRMRREKRKGKAEQGVDSIASFSRQTQLSKNDINSIRRSQVPQLKDTLRQLREKEMLPAIWFIFSRRGCDAAVQYLEDSNLLDECEGVEVELELKRFRNLYPDAVRDIATRGLLHGIAAHHAGCLPLWKSFIEELFQRGLVKLVFATETLAAGINMPARTAVISSLSKRGEIGRIPLSSNDLLQMAGRSGRRGIDDAGHVVLLQSPYEGAEECCDILFSGLEPLVSQFTASYGMVLNLLAGAKVTHKLKEPDGLKTVQSGRTLEEARKLVEQSFGNYVGSNVMLAAKEELNKIKQEIELLSLEVSEDAIDRKCQEQLSEAEYAEISDLQEELRREKRLRTELRREMEFERMAAWKPLLKEVDSCNLPFMCLQYKDNEAVPHVIPAVFIGKLSSMFASRIMDMVNLDALACQKNEATSDLGDTTYGEDCKPAYYVALGSDNSWYLFTEKWIKTIYKTGFSNVPLADGDIPPQQTLMELLKGEDLNWEKISDSEFGSLWSMEGSMETWSWSLNVPVLSSLSDDDEVRNWSQAYKDAVERYKEQRTKVSRLRKKITNTKGFKEFKKITDFTNFTKEKIKRMTARSHRLIKRIEQIEPSGWKEFLLISKVIQEARALDIDTKVIYPLGETAAAIRGENELWLAMVLRNKALLDLKPAQLAAVCGSLVSEGIKLRPWKNSSFIYEPSSVVTDIINHLESQRSSLLDIQEKYGVKIPCELDSQFSGMVEAWASGLTWHEIMMECAMDEGDLARLLRRTIDLLAQIPKLPDIDPQLQKTAQLASDVMNRAPINELVQ